MNHASRFINEYPENWQEVSQIAKVLANYRCVRCRHQFSRRGVPLPCDEPCDRSRGIHKYPLKLDTAGFDLRLAGLNYGVHHLDGDKRNSLWWNLLPLCNSCHLTFQARVIPEQEYMLAHSAWFHVYVAGYYAAQKGLAITRDEAEADLDRFLAMGQPHLYPN